MFESVYAFFFLLLAGDVFVNDNNSDIVVRLNLKKGENYI